MEYIVFTFKIIYFGFGLFCAMRWTGKIENIWPDLFFFIVSIPCWPYVLLWLIIKHWHDDDDDQNGGYRVGVRLSRLVSQL